MLAFGRREAFQMELRDSEASVLLIFSRNWAGTAAVLVLSVFGEAAMLSHLSFHCPLWGALGEELQPGGMSLPAVTSANHMLILSCAL